jgi:hypothetical protein
VCFILVHVLSGWQGQSHLCVIGDYEKRDDPTAKCAVFEGCHRLVALRLLWNMFKGDVPAMREWAEINGIQLADDPLVSIQRLPVFAYPPRVPAWDVHTLSRIKYQTLMSNMFVLG